MADADGDNACLICVNPFPASEKQFQPCPCGFRMCLWCFHTIVTLTEGSDKPRCPGCRADLNVSAVTQQKPQKVTTARNTRHVEVRRLEPNRKPLADAVCVDARVIVVAGLPPRVDGGTATTGSSSAITRTTLASHAWFGQYGRIVAIALSAIDGVACVRFGSAAEADLAISVADGARVCDPSDDSSTTWTLSVTRGKAKWCPQFLRGEVCTKTTCVDLHELASANTVIEANSAASKTSIFALDPRSVRGPSKLAALVHEGVTCGWHLPPPNRTESLFCALVPHTDAALVGISLNDLGHSSAKPHVSSANERHRGGLSRGSGSGGLRGYGGRGTTPRGGRKGLHDGL